MNYKLYKLLCLAALIAMIIGNYSPVNASSTALQTSNTYYVATNGKDANTGTQAAPWLTIGKALATIKAGDTLIIRGGEYAAPATGWQFSSGDVTLTNYPGEQVILSSKNKVSGNYVIKCLLSSPAVNNNKIIGTDVGNQKGIVITGEPLGIAPAIVAYQCDGWEVAGIEFRSVAYAIFQRKVNNGNTSADGWYVHNNFVNDYYRESGMQFNGNGNRIENNQIYKVTNLSSTTYGCQLLNLLGSNNVVRGNQLERVNQSVRCIGIFFEWDLADANLIENNVIKGVPNGISFFGGDNNIIRNNTLSGTDTAFVIRSWADNVTTYPCNFSDFMPLESNTASPDWQYMYPHDCRSKGNRFENNSVSGFSVFSAVNLSESSNIFISGGTTITPSVPGAPTVTHTQTPSPTAITIVATQQLPTETAAPATATSISTEPPAVTVTPLPTSTTVPIGTTVITSASPKTLLAGQTGTVSVNLANVPTIGFTSIEFTCTFASDTISTSNIQIGSLFGTDPVSLINDSQSGSFIVAIAGSNGNKATSDGTAFTFTVSGLKPGQSNLDCMARVSTGSDTLNNIASIPDIVTVLDNSATATVIPTAAPVLPPTLTGQVLANKTVTVSLLNADSSVAATTTTNADGTFNLTANAGSYIIIASAEGYLNSQGTVTLTGGGNTTLPLISLPAGDIDNNDVIDQYDALTLGMNYNVIAPAAADLSNDGLTNILDLELLAENYRKAGALAWQ